MSRRDAAKAQAASDAVKTVSKRSRYGLFFTNFLLAELGGVLIPLLDDHLADRGWQYESIGAVTAMAGLGLLISHVPIGVWLDKISQLRATLAAAALLVGACSGVLPVMHEHPVLLGALLFMTGVGQAFIVPLLGGLALALAGRRGVNKLMGDSQAWNHAGNIAASLGAMWLVRVWGMNSAFGMVTVVSICAASACFVMNKHEIHTSLHREQHTPWRALLEDRRLQWLLGSCLLFSLANAPITPLVAMYVRTLDGPAGFVTVLVLAAQTTMSGAAWVSGRLGDMFGRKPVLAAAFLILPVRIVLYAASKDPLWFVGIGILDGAAVGIYNVTVSSICADIDAGRGYFNTLLSMAWSMWALGGVVSPVVGGAIVQKFGFVPAFCTFAAIASLAAVVFLYGMSETQDSAGAEPPSRA